MIFEKQLSSLMTAALLCGTFTPFSSGQQAAPASGAVAGAPTAIPAVSAAAQRMQLWSSRPLRSLKTR